MSRGSSAFGDLRAWVWLVVSVGVLLSTGCGGKKSMITGTVTYRGKPLPSGIIKFIDAANKEVVGAATIADGGYSVSGVLPGLVKIVIHLPPSQSGLSFVVNKDETKRPASKPVMVPAKYSNPETSGLTYMVQPGTQQAPPFDLQ